MRIIRSERQKCSVFIIGRIIELRHIETFDLSGTLQKLPPALSGFFPLFICVKQFVINSLALPDIEDIEEISERLRIVRAWSSSDNNGICIRAF